MHRKTARAKLVCSNCKRPWSETSVRDTRHDKEGIKRRRWCRCGARWTTIEVVHIAKQQAWKEPLLACLTDTPEPITEIARRANKHLETTRKQVMSLVRAGLAVMTVDTSDWRKRQLYALRKP